MANKTISYKDFDDMMREILIQYGDAATTAVKDSLTTVAKDTAKQMEDESPPWIGEKGEYSKSWTYAKRERGNLVRVYNKDYGWLTNLLENGHLTRNGGHTRKFPHISSGEVFAQGRLTALVRKKLEML